jgi:hypothetical protein
VYYRIGAIAIKSVRRFGIAGSTLCRHAVTRYQTCYVAFCRFNILNILQFYSCSFLPRGTCLGTRLHTQRAMASSRVERRRRLHLPQSLPQTMSESPTSQASSDAARVPTRSISAPVQVLPHRQFRHSNKHFARRPSHALLSYRPLRYSPTGRWDASYGASLLRYGLEHYLQPRLKELHVRTHLRAPYPVAC